MIGFGLLGGGAGLLGGWQDSQDAEAEAIAQAEAEAEMRAAKIKAQREEAERDVLFAQGQFDIQTEDALRQAAKMEAQGGLVDAKTDLQESLIGQAYNSTMKQLGMSQEQLAAQEQGAKRSFAQSKSAAVSSLGSSGTRAGSSVENVIAQDEVSFSQDLDRSHSQNKLGQDIALAQAYAGLQENSFNVGAARINANETFADAAQLESDYSAGGRATSLFNQQITNRRADLESSIDLQNLGGKFAQEAYGRQMDRAQFTWADAFTSIFSGGSVGLSFGNQTADFFKKW